MERMTDVPSSLRSRTDLSAPLLKQSTHSSWTPTSARERTAHDGHSHSPFPEQGRMVMVVFTSEPSESCNLLLIQNLRILTSALMCAWLIEPALSFSWIN